ncbi:hypothetical protein TYRP_010039 [Tyrophagus putrescentiae]|nr:hypothetical protein TYRP_010039 [Tyrophagus putrescentiae]
MAGTDSAGANGDDELVSTGLRLTEMPRVVNDDDEDYGAGAFASSHNSALDKNDCALDHSSTTSSDDRDDYCDR